MDSMVEFWSAILSAIADFIGSDPVKYLYALVLLLMIVKLFRYLSRA